MIALFTQARGPAAWRALLLAGAALVNGHVGAAQLVQPTPGAEQSVDPAAIARANAQQQLATALAEIARSGADARTLTQAGRAALMLGDPRAALGFLARAEALAPRDPVIKAALGAAMVQLEDPAQAMRFFEAAIALGGLERAYLADRGLAFDLLGDQVRAQADYAAAAQYAPSAEVTRRHAISLGISGNADAAVQLLAPLLRNQDRAAWRSRAMIVAMNGRADEARQIAQTTMPAQLAAGLSPYFGLMDRLTPPQLAAAAHFGRFPSYEVVSAQPSRSRPVAVAAAAPAADARTARTRRDGRRVVAANSSAARQAPRTSSRTRNAAAAAAGLPNPAQTAVRPVVPQPAPVPMPFPPAAAAAQPAPAPTPVPTPAPTPAPAVVAAAPVLQPSLRPTIRPTIITPAPTAAPVAAASAPTPVPAAAASAPMPAPAAVASVSASATPAPVPAPTAAAAPVSVATATEIPQNSAPSAPAAQNVASVTLSPTPMGPPDSGQGNNAISMGSSSSLVAVQAPVAPPSAAPELSTPVPSAPAANTVVVAGWSLADVVSSITIPDSERRMEEGALSLEELDRIATERRAAAATAAAEARRRAAEDSRAREARAAEERARAEQEAEARAEAEARRRHPARTWVQIATGADPAALGFDYRRFSQRNAEIFRGQTGHTAVWNRTRRLVVGPFPNAAAARTWLNRYTAAGGQGFVWTSEQGEEVTPLARR